MAYIGTPPQSGFITTAKQRVTSSTNDYVDLDNSISSLADVIVWVNSVKQDSTNLTLTTSTRITLGDTLTASDVVEIAYLGKAVATQTPDDNTITNDMLVGSIANSKLANSSITLNGSAVSLGGSATVGGENTPSFCAYVSADQSVSSGVWTKVQFNTEVFDTDSAYDNSSNYRFTVPSGEAGKYVIMADVHGANSNTGATSMNGGIYKNGSLFRQVNNHLTANSIARMHLPLNFIDDASVGDYYEYYVNLSGTSTIVEGATGTFGSTFMMYKLIT